MATLYFLRHFPTAWNLAGKLQGKNDVPIIEGWDKYISISSLNIPNVNKVFSSPLLRATQTAEALGYKNYKVNDLLTELDFGPFEGQTKNSLIRQSDGKWLSSPFDSPLKKNLFELDNNVSAFHDLVRDSNDTLLIIGHGAWIRLYYAMYVLNDKNKMNSFAISNGELLKIVIGDY